MNYRAFATTRSSDPICQIDQKKLTQRRKTKDSVWKICLWIRDEIGPRRRMDDLLVRWFPFILLSYLLLKKLIRPPLFKVWITCSLHISVNVFLKPMFHHNEPLKLKMKDLLYKWPLIRFTSFLPFKFYQFQAWR